MRNILSILVYLCVTSHFGYGDINLQVRVNHLKTFTPCDQNVPTGVASLDRILYIVCAGSDIIKTFDAVNYEPKAPIIVKGLKGATDVAIHVPSKSIYVLQVVNGASKVWHNEVKNGVVNAAWASFDLPPNSTPLLHTTHPDWGELEKYVETVSYDPPMIYLHFPNGSLHDNFTYPWTGDRMIYMNVIAIPNFGMYIAIQTDRGWYFKLLRTGSNQVDVRQAADTSCLDLNLHDTPIEDFGYDNKKKMVVVAQPKHKRLIGVYAATKPEKLACTVVSGFSNIAAKRFALDDEQRRLYVVDDIKQVQAFALLD